MSSKIPPEAYDELLLLARDARQRRRRTNIGTTAAVAAAMVLTAGYVISVNQAESPGPEPSTQPVAAQPPAINFEPVINLNPDRGGDLLRVLIEQSGPAGTTASERETTIYRELVWLVEGSRRIPMREGDIAWIPESGRRVQVTDIEPDDVRTVDDRSGVTVVLRVLPEGVTVPNAPGGQVVTLVGARPSDPMLPLRRDVGNARCVVFEQLGQSTRSGFTDGSYVDLDVRFVPEQC